MIQKEDEGIKKQRLEMKKKIITLEKLNEDWRYEIRELKSSFKEMREEMQVLNQFEAFKESILKTSVV